MDMDIEEGELEGQRRQMQQQQGYGVQQIQQQEGYGYPSAAGGYPDYYQQQQAGYGDPYGMQVRMLLVGWWTDTWGEEGVRGRHTET